MKLSCPPLACSADAKFHAGSRGGRVDPSPLLDGRNVEIIWSEEVG